MAAFGFAILVNTDDAFLDLGPFFATEPLSNDDIRALIKFALECKDWDYTLDRVSDVVLTCVDMDTEDNVIFDIEPADVWPTDFDSKKHNNYYAPKGGEEKKHG